MNNHYVVNFDPVIFSLGPLQVRWYGMMYVVGFVLAGFLVKHLGRKGFFKPGPDKSDSLITHVLIGMFIGARIFYVFIYNWDYYSENITDLFAVWKGGLSFHGALAGLLTSGYIFARRNKISWAQTMDTIALAGAPGLFFGRMGNFINGELYGRTTDAAIGMIFPNGGPYPRHPSQLYEGILEGIVLSIILWVISKRVKTYGWIGATFMVGYGFFRYIVEFFREADSQLGYYFGGTTTMGQILCFVMIILGFVAYYIVWKKKWLMENEPFTS
jgi:phosphatidylglycerol---prolipoprotein diacylglyceryl transferase